MDSGEAEEMASNYTTNKLDISGSIFPFMSDPILSKAKKQSKVKSPAQRMKDRKAGDPLRLSHSKTNHSQRKEKFIMVS